MTVLAKVIIHGDIAKVRRIVSPRAWENAMDTLFDMVVMPEAEATARKMSDIVIGGKAGGPSLTEATIRRKGSSVKLVRSDRKSVV